MKKCIVLACCVALPAGALAATPRSTGDDAASGIEIQYIDPQVRAADDFYTHVNGKWLETTAIPPDKPSWSIPYVLHEEVQERLRKIIEDAAATKSAAQSNEARKVGDLYRSFMDEARLETLGFKPLNLELAAIDRMQNKGELPALIAHLQQIGVTTPFDLDIDQDKRNSSAYAAYLSQSGLGLPDRDYYIADDDARLVAIRKKYGEHIEAMLALGGSKTAKYDAADILALETAIARAQWTKVESRDPVKTYTKVATKDLAETAPGFGWSAYLGAAGVAVKVSDVVLYQASYLKDLGALFAKTPLSVWKAYFKWQVLRDYARFLDKRFVDERFAFYGTTLSGVPQNRPRWQRGVALVNEAIGEALGRVYVVEYFPPERKARMEKLVANLLAAYKQSIDDLDWMGRGTKKEAQAKLAKITPKIGYPVKWRDYSKLVIAPDDLVGNVMRAHRFELDRNVAKLGKPIDRDEWYMTPQTVNAYYNPLLNEIVFPAGYLQPPYFNSDADDAANYGGVGATIGHEISHAFDDSGSQFDGDGNLRDWWTPEDHVRFDEKTKALVAQYDAYSPVPGYQVNGKLTLGENIADLSGLAIAYKAYRLSLGGKQAPIIDGMSGDERFFLSYAQGWRSKTREEQQIVYLKSDPHSPDHFRCNGTLSNLDVFYATFRVKEGDKMYLMPTKRVSIW
ncbi:MAG: M13 family metallopeptidase [Pseudomonadota bacterium]|nr:M13 family metallopeptidase [Pseudomonadota bacterium]